MVETFYWTKFRKNVIKNQNCKECQQDGGMLCEEGILRVGGNVQNTNGREKEEPSRQRSTNFGQVIQHLDGAYQWS